MATTDIHKPYGVAAAGNGAIIMVDAAGIPRLACRDTSHALCNGKTAGNTYILDNSDAEVQSGPGNSFTIDNYALGVDSRNNYYYSGDSAVIDVICNDSGGTGFCAGKTVGNTYRVTGTGTVSDPGGNVSFAGATAGTIRAIALDAFDNIIYSDRSYNYVRILCVNTSGVWCTGKTAGNSYNLAGTGTSTDGGEGVANMKAIITPYGLDTDSHDNIFVSHFGGSRITVICGTMLGACAGKAVGSINYFAGTGTSGADNNVAPLSGKVGSSGYALHVDPFDNVLYASGSSLIQIICQSTSNTCSQSAHAPNSLYVVVGTTSPGDAANDVAPTGALVGTMKAVATDNYGNVFISANNKLRIICYDLNGPACAGRSVDRMYTLHGSGTLVDRGVSNTPLGTNYLMAGTAAGAMKPNLYGQLIHNHAGIMKIFFP